MLVLEEIQHAMDLPGCIDRLRWGYRFRRLSDAVPGIRAGLGGRGDPTHREPHFGGATRFGRKGDLV